METLTELVDAYRAAVARGDGSRVLAELEATIREVAPAHVPRSPYENVMRWQSELLGITQHVITCHRDLWNTRGPAETLWERVDAGMPLGTAKRLMWTARKRVGKRDREGLKRAIDEEVQRFYGQSGGASPAAPGETAGGDAVDISEPNPRDFLRSIRKAVMAHLEPRVGALPEHERDKLLDDLERDLQALLSQHNSKWQKLSRTIKDQKRVSRQKFVNSLRVLHMDPPRRNAPLAPIVVQANKQKRTLARLYHPDSHGGSQHTVAQYQAVLDAFLLIEQYVSENTAHPKKPSLRLVGAGQ